MFTIAFRAHFLVLLKKRRKKKEKKRNPFTRMYPTCSIHTEADVCVFFWFFLRLI